MKRLAAPGTGPAAETMPDPAPPLRAPRLPPGAAPAPGPRTATRNQRLALVLGLLAAVLFLLWLFSAILTPFVLAACIAYFLDPLATRVSRLGIPRGLAALVLVTGLMGLALIALLLLYPLIIAQVGTLLARLPSYAAGIASAVQEALAALEERFGPEVFDTRLRDLAVSQIGAILSFLGTAATRLIGGGYALFSVFTLVVVTPVVAFYLLRDWPRIMLRLESWLPRRSAAVLRQLARDTDRVLSAWLRGQLLCCALLAAYYAVGLSAVGLELGLMVGLASGLLSFIPYVGSATGLATALLLAVGQFGTWDGVGLVAAVYIAGQTIEGYIIYPRLLGDRVELHAVWVIFALFAGGVAFGFLGVLLAVPMAAALGVLARYWLRRYLESPLYLDPPRTGL
ncbi:AI-2E family transporter [Pseudoroseomonas cervicalis]|uniref:AI-2E family transporter n=1 Tax=Teichococcus cervicalis TaxID=204525 RepID=UPI0022F17802|nr:AI-2E family transporter [Pseudoroseomonas cervicalis]WBV42362.1 AI-2E family transporter [Pseudoroseomonas cervicalis]